MFCILELFSRRGRLTVPTICDLGLVFLAEDLGRAFGIPVGAGSGLAPTKMLISLEGAHVFWMSIFGELEQLRQLKAM